MPLLGFLGHYLGSSGEVRRILIGWIFDEMRSRLGFIARELTAMPASTEPSSGGIPFTLPPQLALPDDEVARWRLHRDRTTAAIAVAQRLTSAAAPDPLNEYPPAYWRPTRHDLPP
jgi:hypothetical protein